MSFEAYELSRAKGLPIALYQFFVENRQFLYTDAEREVTIDGIGTFSPLPIQRGRIVSSGTLDKASLEIEMPRSAAVAEAFRVYPPGEVVNLIIRDYHYNDPAKEALVVWTGRILGNAWVGDRVRLTGEPVSTSLKRAGLRRHYQYGCPHQLYGPQCLASKLLGTTPEILVAAASNTTVILPAGWIPAGWPAAKKNPAKFVGGMMVWEYDDGNGPVEYKRTILRITNGVQVVLSGIATGLLAGSPVKMVIGCAHDMADCKNIHNNIKNFGGQPWIPTKNPFSSGNQFY